MNKNDPRKALGKGLHSLLPTRNAPAQPTHPEPIAREGTVVFVPTSEVQPNPHQPRREFDSDAMAELTQSVERDGVIQPVLVRQTAPNEYQIIAGERRWRAAVAAGLKEIPVIPRAATDHQVLELSIIENIQREDLNPVELALAFQRMGAELGLSHDEIGEKTGKDRATITNTIRLLQLPPDLQQLIAAKQISQGHARALLKLSGESAQRLVAKRCIEEGWSVRQIEDYTRTPKPASQTTPSKQPTSPAASDPNVRAAITELESRLGTRVRILEKAANKGAIEIEYYSAGDLDRIYNIITGESL